MLDWNRDGDDEFVLFEAREEAYVSNDGEKGTRRRYQIFVESKINQVAKADANHRPSRAIETDTIELTSFSLGPDSPFEFGSKFIPGNYQPRFILTFGDINNDGMFDIVFAPLARASVDIPRGIFAMLNQTDSGEPKFGNPVKISELQPKSLAIADVDQDGNPDLVVNDSGSIKILVMHRDVR